MIITIEGVDGCGKATQSKLLYEKLKAQGKNCRLISFPRYDCQSTYFVKKFLNGDYGMKFCGIPASIFYALDRMDYFSDPEVKTFLDDGGILICDRYTTSNFDHQAAFEDTEEKKLKAIEEIKKLEYEMYSIPRPDKVIFLKIPPKFSEELIESRTVLKNGCDNDIFEDKEINKKAYYNACYVAEQEHWDIVNCVDDNGILPPDAISDKIINILDDENYI